jgi:hypothetical protein
MKAGLRAPERATHVAKPFVSHTPYPCVNGAAAGGLPGQLRDPALRLEVLSWACAMR